MTPLSSDDLVFLRKDGTYAFGPTLDLCWYPIDVGAVADLRSAFLRDPTIATDVDVASPHSGDLTRVVWRPEGLPPVGLTISEIASDQVYAFLCPPHIERATGEPWCRCFAKRGPGTWSLFAAGAALARRLHRCIPLRRATILDETCNDAVPETGVIVLPRPVAEAAAWPHTLTVHRWADGNSWLAMLPLGDP